jgi:hypothetical protein
LLPNGFVDDFMIGGDLFFDRKLEVFHTSVILLQVHITEASVEEYLAGVQPELQPQLLVINAWVSAQVEKGVVEINQSLFEVAIQEIGDALLEVCDGQILVKLNTALVAFDL